MVRDRSSGLPVQDELDHFAWIYARTVDRTAEEFDAVNHPMLLVDQDQTKALIIQVPEPHREVFANLLGRLK